ncbi:MAG: hypothetical protein QF692_05365 [Alphaproteobacteria bacterium]|jgi:hypothetical protein|nr:hypothetical protein [Alphaproteobacteria bacterium]MDP7222674.1 hypothetical protein [Alphaproteobacteria bacterium]
MTKNKTLRIGLLIKPDLKITRWQQDILDRISSISSNIHIVVAYYDTACTKPQRKTSWSKKLWLFLTRLEGKVSFLLSGGAGRCAGLRNDISDFYPDIALEGIKTDASASGLVRFVPQDKVHEIQALDLDVILNFGWGIIKGDILVAAKYGILSYHHADNRINRGSPPGFWEWYYKQPHTGVTLQKLTDDLDNGEVIRRGLYKTQTWSWSANYRHACWASRFLMSDSVHVLYLNGCLTAVPEDDSVLDFYSQRLFVAPKFREQLLAGFKLILRYAVHFWTKLLVNTARCDYWSLLFFRGSMKKLSARKAIELKPPAGHFWADPFVVEQEDSTYIFVEDWVYETQKGRISVLTVENSRVVDNQVALDCPYHLSYPFVFKYGNAFYMIPETHKNNTIELWRCKSFPNEWEKDIVLMNDVCASDTTLTLYDGKWWMFTNIARGKPAFTGYELHIFYTDDPVKGKWKPHALNPVVTNSKIARMGGHLYMDDQKLFRVSQESNMRYGEGVVVHEVCELTPFSYKEVTRESVKPHWAADLVGIHHISYSKHYTVMDVCRRKWKWRV